MIKGVKFVVNCTVKGFEYLSFMLVKGIYFYLYLIVSFFKKIFKNSKSVEKMYNFIQQKPRSAESSLLVVFAFVVVLAICDLLFFNVNDIVILDKEINVEELKLKDENYEEKYDVVAPEIEESKNYDKSLFKYYGNMKLNQIDFNSLKNTNSEVVGWIIVDGTNINYPVVKTNDNDHYLNYNFNNIKDSTGWPFMDYRNNISMSDDNTIFYGHNLLNNTSFGSISKIFTNNWLRNSSGKVIYLTDNVLYTYQIFSAYYINPENYYLQTNLDNKVEFLNKLKSRSIVSFNVDVSVNDKIITLSTCTNDNTGRKVIHAKLVSQENY